jgi:hypothetical protein
MNKDVFLGVIAARKIQESIIEYNSHKKSIKNIQNLKTQTHTRKTKEIITG